MRTLAIGDIHGCMMALMTVMEFAKVSNDDLLITLGDYVNRGPDSKSVLDWLVDRKQNGKLVALKGNHEVMMLSCRADKAFVNSFRNVGGDQTLSSYVNSDPNVETELSIDVVPQSHWDFLQDELVRYHEDENHIYVHASVYPEVPLDKQPDFMLFWEFYDDPCRHESGKRMICGHSSQKSGVPAFNDHSVCIDTWAHGGGWLSCFDVATNLVWQANQKGETRKFFLGDKV